MTQAHLGRVLVVDNDPHFRRSVEVLLDATGYTVYAAGTEAEARQIATRERVHVAVLDIRMKSDPDHDDISGLDLAGQLDPLIVKIMLSAYPSVATVRSSFGDISAFAFVDKEEGPDKLLEELARAFEERVRINFDLSIRWQDNDLQEVASGIEVDEKPDPDVLEEELEEVLRKLFFEAEEIRVALLIPGGQTHPSLSGSGAALLKVQPCYPGSGWGAPVVVKVATRGKTAVEGQNYDQYVEGFIAGFRHTRLYARVQTHLLGGIIYTLVGTPLDECVDLGTFYVERPEDETIEVLKRLFREGCRHWYANRGDRTAHDLAELYGKPLKLSPERLESALHEVGLSDWVGGGEERHKVPGLGPTLVNPIQWLRSHPSLPTQVSLCYTHGDMHSRNVLVDQNRYAWLIDFYRTGPGHLFRDLIELESDIKFVLLEVTDLPSLLRFETALLSASNLDERPTLPRFKDPDLRKAFFVVLALRQIASELAPEAYMLDYYQGLLLQTLAMIRLRHVAPAKKRHAYLAASLLCQRLDEW